MIIPVQPKKQLITALQDKLDTASGPELFKSYQVLKAKYPDDYNFNEPALNVIGYTLWTNKHFDSAIAVFEYNTALFLNSGNAFDSLAEAYYNQGDKAKSLLNYRRAPELAPSSAGAKEKINYLLQLK